MFPQEHPLQLCRLCWNCWKTNYFTGFLPFLVRCHLIEFTVRAILVSYNLLHNKAVNVFVKKTCSPSCILYILWITRLNGTLVFEKPFDFLCQITKKAFNYCTV